MFFCTLRLPPSMRRMPWPCLLLACALVPHLHSHHVLLAPQARCAVLGLLAALLRADAGVRRAAMREPELVSTLTALVWDPRMRAAALSLVRISSM